MNINAAFPSSYIKHADLGGKELTLHMSNVTIEDLGDDQKPVVHFHDHDKGLALNKTNALEISAAYGDETTDWTGKPITLYPAKTLFGGRQVDCIRVRVNGAAKQPLPDSTPATNVPVAEPARIKYALRLIDEMVSRELVESSQVEYGRAAIQQPGYAAQKLEAAIAKWEGKLTEAGFPLPSAAADDLPF